MLANHLEYASKELVTALRQIRLHLGDTIYVQMSAHGLEHFLPDAPVDAKCEVIVCALKEALGPNGMIVVPAFSHSFENGGNFDAEHTPSAINSSEFSHDFAEYFRKFPDVVRSCDPNWSVAVVGSRASELICELPNTTFGKDCVFDRLSKWGAKILSLGTGIAAAPILHHVEEMQEVPFRYKKLFTGRISDGRSSRQQGWITSVSIQATNSDLDTSRIEKAIREEGLVSVAPIGAEEIALANCSDLCQIARRMIAQDSWITARGPNGNPIELENLRTNAKKYDVELTANASMEELISKLWRLPRDIISDGYDSALLALSTQIPMNVHEYPTGSECWTWVVPEKWTCHEAWVETLDGRRLFSYSDNPLHVVSYSLPVEGVISREELFKHLHVHPKMQDAIPFVFKYYERDWGFCCSKNFKETLKDEQYRVLIKSDSSYGTLKVGEIVVPGQSSETFVLCAHLCHPAMVNDDLSGVVVGIKVMQALLERSNLYYTYRFLILPETIGSVAHLSHHPDLIPKMAGGLFLEMLGLQNPHALQLSFRGDTELDRCLSRILNESDPLGWTGPFRTVVGNDERQFNAPGVRVPMLSLSRVLPRNGNDWPYYPEYHSSADDPDRTDQERLAASCALVLKMIDAFEQTRIPRNLYQGEIFCSRYGLNVDVYNDPAGNRALFDIIFLIDGTRSIEEIARLCGISSESATKVIRELKRHGLVACNGV